MMPAQNLFSLDFSNYISTGFSWLDDRLGNKTQAGGFGPGKHYFITGDPNAGKSTLLLQMADRISKKKIPVLFISAELGQMTVVEYMTRLGITEPKFLISFDSNPKGVLQTVEAFARYCQKQGVNGVIFCDSLQGIAPIGTTAWLKSYIDMLDSYGNIANVMLGWSRKDGQAKGGSGIFHLFDVHVHINDTGKGKAGGQKREITFKKNRQGHTGMPIKALLTGAGYRIQK